MNEAVKWLHLRPKGDAGQGPTARPLFALLLGASQSSPPSNSLTIDDADAWQAICKDGARVGAVTAEGICQDHRCVAMWTNKPRAERMTEEAAK